MHYRCAQCAEFTARIKNAAVESERAQILRAHSEHLAMVQAFRSCQTCLNHMSEDSCDLSKMSAGSGAAAGGRLLKLDVDYVDQAKFRIPRNLMLTKRSENLWRPQLHTAGILLWGVA